MKVLNILWHFSTGGIGKCFLTYDKLGEYNHELEIKSVCIIIDKFPCDIEPLQRQQVDIIHIKTQLDTSWVMAIGRMADAFHPDVIFCHGFNGPVVAKVASVFYPSMRVPMVCSYHGLYNPPTKNKEVIANAINRIQAWVYKHLAHTVVLVAKYSGEYLLERGVQEQKMTVVYNGLDKDVPEGEPMPLDHTGVSIGLASRIDAIKGIEYLLEAIKLLKERSVEKFHLYIVGDGPLLDEQQQRVKALGIGHLVSYEGYSNQVVEWLKAWDIFCLPSLQENHSIALLEAMRAGKAIVCTNVGGNPETVGNGVEAFIVPSRNPEALAEALQKFIEDARLRKSMGEKARERFLTCFTEDVMKQQLCEILNNAHK